MRYIGPRVQPCGTPYGKEATEDKSDPQLHAETPGGENIQWFPDMIHRVKHSGQIQQNKENS